MLSGVRGKSAFRLKARKQMPPGNSGLQTAVISPLSWPCQCRPAGRCVRVSLARTILSVFLVLATGLAWSAPETPTPVPRYGRVLVVANRNSPASLEAAAIYAAARNLPPANVLSLPLSSTITFSQNNFEKELAAPLRDRLQALAPAVDFVVLARDVPYRVGSLASTAAILFGGVEQVTNRHWYSGREDFFEAAVPYYMHNLQPATVLSGYTIADIEKLVYRSRNFHAVPKRAGTFYFCLGEGPRGNRNGQIDAAVALLRRQGFNAVRVESPNISNRHDVLGQFTGSKSLNLASNTYLPGSIIDNMTSLGGYLLEDTNQMSVLSFLQHGASGSYGTVVEPTNRLDRWADYTIAARYAAGFNLIESYLQTIRDMSVGTVVGDPLTAPFARPSLVRATPRENEVKQPGKLTTEISVREGVSGEGISWVEVWLDDQQPVMQWMPALPAGSKCTLQIVSGGKTLYEKNHWVINDESIAETLSAFAFLENGLVETVVCGKRSNRLLVRWIPQPAQPAPLATAIFDIACNDQRFTTSVPLFTGQVTRPAITLDFGSAEPAFGDEVVIAAGDVERRVRATKGETLERMLERLQTYLAATPLFAADGPLTVQLQKMDIDPPQFSLIVMPKDASARDLPVLNVTVNRKPGSELAPMLNSGKAAWREVVIARAGEGILTPLLPAPQFDLQLSIDTAGLAPGEHQLLCIAGTPRGVEQQADFLFQVLPPANETLSGYVMPTVIQDLNEPFSLQLDPAPRAANAFPHLFIDGQHVQSWPPGTRIATYVLDPTIVSPGRHRAWVEWLESESAPAFSDVRPVIERSASSVFYVRRPLTSGLTWSPQTQPAGAKARLVFKGPYLREGLTLFVGDRAMPLHRSLADGHKWTANLSGLPPGTYQLVLVGNAKEETLGELPDPITLTAPETAERQ
jgi:uncharacterized protein (TIGR03790 family)